ncbi:MAG: DNA alkylation repair protein, partial [Butyricicoccus sp.]|nr:DNA alkylation repair protein [Butyricicoccus sp.]
MTDVQKALFELQDLKYRDFHSKLMPTVDPACIIGVRTPQLRKFAKAFAKSDAAEIFLKDLPHRYYEENNLHGFLIECMQDFDEVIAALNAFLPYVDNWATCDLMRPKVFLKNREKLLPHIRRWMCSAHAYTVRFGMEMLMVHFLDEDFKPE